MVNNYSRTRVSVFIDGFNVYHFLNNTPALKRYKWLDYNKLARCFIPPSSDIVSINYFTALATWDNEKVRRHKIYLDALSSIQVNTFIGKFKDKEKIFVIENSCSKELFKKPDGRKFKGCKHLGYTFEEKQTDVNIGVQLIASAYKDEFDTALLISGDTDFEPAISYIQNNFTNKEIRIAVPNKEIARSLKKIVGENNFLKIKEKHLSSSQLSDPVTLLSGRQIFCPDNWK